ncbi:MAG: hypothetical protein GX868_14565 [Actinobacteria bacterium]|nr:hypothetical protein [Actinomycetota bacterium]
MMRLDFTQESIVIVCESCPGVWFDFAFTKLEAWERAAAHEQRTHPGETQAAKALSYTRRTSPSVE